MYCLANICYVCLEKKNKLISNINNSSDLNNDFIDIIGYRPFNLAWLKTKRIILICEECCLRLRETYQFLKMCHKNSALLQGYVENLNNISIPNTNNEAELNVMLYLNLEYNNKNEIKCEIPNEQMYTLQAEPIIEETFEDDVVVKEETICKEEEIDDKEEYTMDNNSTDIAVNSSNAHVNNTDCVNSGFTCEQVHETNQKDLNTGAKKLYNCTMCSKSFITAAFLKVHVHIHTGEKPYQCRRCGKCFSQQATLKYHMQTHADDKPYECSECGKCFKRTSGLYRHEEIHTGVKKHSCSICEKCFYQKSELVSHMRVHTGEKPYKCPSCEKCFRVHSHLVDHIRIHTGEKPYKCPSCEKCFRQNSTLKCHIRTHTGEKPYECLQCGKYFISTSELCKHKFVHTAESTCSICKKCFGRKSHLVQHMRTHNGEKWK